MSKPLVSYIIASFNHEQFIERTLRSIINQTVTDIEVFVIDDGSGDRTFERAQSIAIADKRVTVIRESHGGVVAARNKGIKLATAALVSIIDSDDTIPIDRTERFLKIFYESPGCVLAYGDAALIDHRDRVIGRFWRNYPPKKGEFATKLFSSYCFVPAVSVMFKRSVLVQSGLFWGQGPNTDYLKWIELGLLGEVIRIDGAPLGSWRLHENNTSRSGADRIVARYEDLQLELTALLQRNPKLLEILSKRTIDKRFSRCFFMGGVNAMTQKKWERAMQAFKRSYSSYRSPLYLLAILGCSWPIRSLSNLVLSVILKLKAPVILLK